MPRSTAPTPLSRLYREHFDAVWATLRRLGVPAASLEDAVHDVFMVVHRQLEGFEGRSTVRTWILGIARRVAFRHRRTLARTQRRHQALATVPPPRPDPDDDLARHEGWRALQGFLDELDEDKRAAFVLGELERLTREELGVALGVSPNTAYSRLRAARAQFQVRFAEAGAAPVLAAGRKATPAPAESRQRVWLLVTGSLRDAVVPATMWSAKALLVTMGLATAGLGTVALVAPGRSHGRTPAAAVVDVSSRASATSVAATDATRDPAAAMPRGPARPPADTTTATHVPAAIDEARGSSARPVSSPRTPRTTDAAAPADDLAEEAVLVLDARRALEGGHPEAALALLDEHRRRFPAGVLAEERDAIRIHAHCAAGRHGPAHAQARALVAAHPRSAYLDALADSCAAAVINPARAGDPPK